MKKYNSIFYFLFILLVMGAFASMAQNSYGLKIMGAVAFVFGFIFILEFISLLRKTDEKKAYTLVELVCLFIISIVFGFRVFYVRFPYIELLFAVAALLLAFLYFIKMRNRFLHFQNKNSFLAILVIVFHLSIVLFLVSMALVPFAPKIAEVAGLGALILLVAFMIAGFFKRNLLVDGVNVSAFTMVRRFKGHSIIIVSLLLLFSLFVGLNRVGLLPDIYSDEFPRVYYELVNNATTKKEKSVDGKYKYEVFKERYDEFLKHNKIKN